MRCLSCDVALSDAEATRKSSITNEFIDLCNHCFSTIAEDIAIIEEDSDVEDTAAEE